MGCSGHEIILCTEAGQLTISEMPQSNNELLAFRYVLASRRTDITAWRENAVLKIFLRTQ
jgi:hypothetical protein